jgi:hypothetical protein
LFPIGLVDVKIVWQIKNLNVMVIVIIQVRIRQRGDELCALLTALNRSRVL